MYIYILVYLTIVILNLFSLYKKLSTTLSYFFFLVFLIVFVGFRYKVGGDWYPYYYHFLNLNLNIDDFFFNLYSWDIGYVLIEYVAKIFKLDIWGVNSLCATIFGMCFLYFIRSFNLKLTMALVISFPYLIMVVVSGYSRQGVAIGFIMAMISALYKGKYNLSYLFFFLSVLFHKTAIIGGIIYFFYKNFLTIKNLVIINTFLALIYFFLNEKLLFLIEHYFFDPRESSGGIIRIMLNVIAFFVLILFYKKYKKVYSDYFLWFWMGFFSFLVFFLTLKLHTTTLGDRILLYFYPLQIVVYSRIIYLTSNNSMKIMLYIGIILLYFLILLIWLSFAANRFSWIPYNNFLFKVLE